MAAALVLAGGAVIAAPAAQAQTAYDLTLRSIGPATITSASFDGRARQAILSIGPSSVENSPSIVPAVFDPTVGRFVSVLANGRGAISVNATSAVSVIVTSQTSSVQVGGGQTGVPLRSEGVSGPSSVVSTQQTSSSVSAVAN
jgi:hypothetical protein